jgi:hypothetical protein
MANRSSAVRAMMLLRIGSGGGRLLFRKRVYSL